jgi:hypothetical protein
MSDPLPEFRYSHRPKPFSSDLDLRLDGKTLYAERGRSKQEFALKGIERLRLSYSPRNTAKLVFRCDIRASDGKTMRFDNLSWVSMIQTTRQDGDYARFVEALVARTASAGGTPVFEAGIGILRYRFMQIAGYGMIVALSFAAVFAASRSSYIVAIACFALGLYLIWWLLEFLTRNKPRSFSPGAIPPGVMPALRSTVAAPPAL